MLPHPQLQRSVVMVKKDLAKISTIRKMVLEHDFTAERNVATEVVPFLQAETKRLLESLGSSTSSIESDDASMHRPHPIQRCHALQILLCRLECISRFANFSRHVLY
jgi:hypothetical protein